MWSVHFPLVRSFVTAGMEAISIVHCLVSPLPKASGNRFLLSMFGDERESCWLTGDCSGSRKCSWCYYHYGIQYREGGIFKTVGKLGCMGIQGMGLCFAPSRYFIFPLNYTGQIEDAIDFKVTQQGNVSTIVSPLVSHAFRSRPQLVKPTLWRVSQCYLRASPDLQATFYSRAHIQGSACKVVSGTYPHFPPSMLQVCVCVCSKPWQGIP